MPYATLSQLTDRYGAQMLVGLTDRGEVATGTVNAATIARALADTDAVIDSYLAGRYALPLAEVPPMLTDLAQVIAIWKLHPHQPDAKIELDYKEAMRTLREIGEGKARIPAAGVEPEGTGGSGARITDRERPLTAENLRGFI